MSQNPLSPTPFNPETDISIRLLEDDVYCSKSILFQITTTTGDGQAFFECEVEEYLNNLKLFWVNEVTNEKTLFFERLSNGLTVNSGGITRVTNALGPRMDVVIDIPLEIYEQGVFSLKAEVNIRKTELLIFTGEDVLIETECRDTYYDITDDEFTLKTFQVKLPEDPIRLGATQEECGTVTLNWEDPADLPFCLPPKYVVSVFRNGGQEEIDELSTTTGTTITYNVPRIYYGEDLEFRLLTRFKLATDEYISSIGNASITGKNVALADPPPELEATVDNCNNSIEVSWAPNLKDGESYTIAYFENNREKGVQTVTDNSTFRINYEGLDKSKFYSFDISSKNSCGDITSTNTTSNIRFQEDLAAPSLERINASDSNIELQWSDDFDFETGFEVFRINETGVEESIARLDPNVTTFKDERAGVCIDYVYTVRVYDDCNPEGLISNSITAKTQPNLDGALPEDKFLGTKGIHPNKVVLSWENTKDNQLNTIKVRRRPLGSGEDFVLIETLNSGSGIYADNSAEAGILYEYQIQGEGQCNNTTIRTETATTIGFRAPIGTITGKVTYAGGTAVSGVRIGASSPKDKSNGTSILLNGNSGLFVPPSDRLNPGGDFLMEAWWRPNELDQAFLLFGVAAFEAKYIPVADSAKIEFEVKGVSTLSAPMAALSTDRFTHFAVQVFEGKMQIFRDGQLLAEKSITLPNLDFSSSMLIGEDFNGYLDEIRFWKKGKSLTEMAQDFSTLQDGENENLLLYLRIMESAGDQVYDFSNFNNRYNNNHASILSGSRWSTEAPDSETQLSAAGYTDEDGNYSLVVPYNGSGETFILTPRFLTHTFAPSTRALFVGDGSFIFNNIDFSDESSFRVTGRVTYTGTQRPCPVEGATLYIDGNPVNKGGQLVKTGSDGYYEISVPIGPHTVSVQQQEHTYELGEITENFQRDDLILNFKDSTRFRVIGRAVGGLREGNKKLGFGKSINNMGATEIIFTASNGCYADTITTVDTTGEYQIRLLPLSYNMEATLVNDTNQFKFSIDRQLNLKKAKLEKTLRDTIFEDLPDEEIITIIRDDSGVIIGRDTTIATNRRRAVGVDSISFYEIQNFIHRADPKIEVTGKNGVDDFTGDSVFVYTDPVTSARTQIDLRSQDSRFNWPIFQQSEDEKALYTALVRVFEEYTNVDNGNRDLVPTTDGKLVFDNRLSDLPFLEKPLKDVNTVDTLKTLIYKFRAGLPNFNTNPDSKLSFTKTFDIRLETSDNRTFSWEPNGPGGGPFRGFVIGSGNSEGQWFPFGPQVPEYVLRDPPGSNSFASREIGTTKSEVNSWDWNTGIKIGTKDKLFIGAKFLAGLGFAVETEIKANISAGFSAELNGGRSGSQSLVTTNTDAWSTNSSTDDVGTPGDLYIGKSQNIIGGTAQTLNIVPDSLCGTRVECSVSIGNGFSISESSTFALIPGGFETHFIYSQNHILTNVLPTLKKIRNGILQGGGPKYQSKLDVDDPNYGKNNDDPAFGHLDEDNSPFRLDPADYDGMSYKYNPVTLADSLQDSVRLINTQIRLWEDFIAKNEWEKVNITKKEVIDSIEQAELDKIYDEYEEYIIAHGLLAGASGILGAAAIKVVASPTPGTATAGYAVFALTTAAGIADAEVVQFYNEYLIKKKRIEDKFASIRNPINRSISGGSSFKNTISHQAATSYTESIEYGMDAGLYGQITAKINGSGVGLEKSLELSFSSGRDWSTEESTTETVSYTLFDQDQGDTYSIDIYPSILGWGPVFRVVPGGQTGCPYQDEEVTQFYEPGSIIQGKTRARDQPAFARSKSELKQTNIPQGEPAIFEITVQNNSLSAREYRLQLINTSNPDGALVRIDGGLGTQLIQFPPTQDFKKTITVEKGPGSVYNYDSLLLVLYPPCQFAGGTTDNIDLADSIYLSVSFVPSCTDLILQQPGDKWVVNVDNEQVLPIQISDYNYNSPEFKSIRLEKKLSNEGEAAWKPIETFYKEAPADNPMALLIPQNNTSTIYQWDVSDEKDGLYDLRVISQCDLAINTSQVYSGIIDEIRPTPFGTPSPADGILSPNDEISIRFNEPIDVGFLDKSDFTVVGILNGTTTDHSTSIAFDGNDDFLEVFQGPNLSQRDFTIELSVRRRRNGIREALISQGTDTDEAMFLGFNSADQLEFSIGSQKVVSDLLFQDEAWHYIAISYKAEEEKAQIHLIDDRFNGINNPDGQSLMGQYTGQGRMLFAKNTAGNADHFQGNIHGVRIWNYARTIDEFSQTFNKRLNINELGLLYNWRMDAADGPLAIDQVRRRDATLEKGATWQVEPGGYAIEFNGMDYLQMNSSKIAISERMDFTLEFWFNSSQSGSATLFSNGSGDAGATDSESSWTIGKDAANRIVVRHNGQSFIASQQDFFDGEWHHFALVMQRTGNLAAYIDGNQQNTISSSGFGALSGPSLFLGAKGYLANSQDYNIENHFIGKIDEFRLWDAARKAEQIRRDKQNRMQGDELGLLQYLPFEVFAGNEEFDPTLLDQVTLIDTLTLNPINNFTPLTPTIKLARDVEDINFDMTVNVDEIIITPTTSSELIENITLDITLENIKDLQGNQMVDKETWIAFVDKNQIVWQDDLFFFNLENNQELEFSSAVLNQGGRVKTFTISNIPEWLEVQPASGSIPPNSVLPIRFTISADLNIGNYLEDLLLTTDFGFPERLSIDVQVRAEEPEWAVNPEDFENTMSIIGQLEINNIISSDEEDIIAAFVDGEPRGRSYVRYMPQDDRYLVFLDIYGDSLDNEALSFKIWDASAGIIYENVSPRDLNFRKNSFIGSLSSPQLFATSDLITASIPLKRGWNWISNYLYNQDSTNLDVTLASLNADDEYFIKHNGPFASYSPDGFWVGTLLDEGIQPEKMYKLRTSQTDTLEFIGSLLDPSTRHINLVNNWNWIGFISIRNQSLQQALSGLEPSQGDLIKGKTKFAVYDTLLQWVGSLETLIPGEGYLYRSDGDKSFSYPVAGLFRNDPKERQDFTTPFWNIDEGLYPSNMTCILSLNNTCGLNGEDYAVGIFDQEDQCRALMPMEGEEELRFLSILGDQSEQLKIMLLNLREGTTSELPQVIDFRANQHLGQINAPYVLDITEPICSDIEQLEQLKAQSYRVYPNIFKEQLNVDFWSDSMNEKLELRLYNAQGQQFLSQRFLLSEGLNQIQLNLEEQGLPAGVYFLSLFKKAERFSTKLIKY